MVKSTTVLIAATVWVVLMFVLNVVSRDLYLQIVLFIAVILWLDAITDLWAKLKNR